MKNSIFLPSSCWRTHRLFQPVRPTWEENFNGKELDTTVWSKIPVATATGNTTTPRATPALP